MGTIRATCALLMLFTAMWTSAVPVPCRAGDWPMWHHDAARSSASPDDLPQMLHLQWTRKLPLARPAWPASQTKLQFDVSYEPVVFGRRMFVGSNVNDSVTAYDTRSGEELWRFYTDGPVRFAPAAANRRVYVCSDDGYLYCLDAETGKAGQTDRIGVNFGAPGDRRDDNGTLWLDYPDVGGPSPKVTLKVDANKPRWFRRHSSLIDGDGPNWVAASGGIGIRSVALDLGKSKMPRRYTIHLHFSEPDDVKRGGRVFTILLQGKPVLESFDIAKAAGGRNRAVVKEFADVEVNDTLNVVLRPIQGKPPLLSGIEVVRAQE